MKKLMLAAVMAVCGAILAGCAGMAVPRVAADNVPVVVAAGNNLRNAVVQAAMHRRWNVQALANGDIRCQILQRSNKVTIDIVVTSETTYTIKFVESNIPTRKYNQWVGNLQREIARWAAR